LPGFAFSQAISPARSFAGSDFLAMITEPALLEIRATGSKSFSTS
jgi:hypothetical protein